ncbi:MAG TPA: protein kinase, partial [Polyangiaceae bacterium]|nr:protein kinase [Polyangiaceae bacterium]
MTVRGQSYELVESLGEGATSQVWLAEGNAGRLVLKLARDRAQRGRLAEEATRLMFVDAPGVASLVAAGVLAAPLHAHSPAGAVTFESGTAYLALRGFPGRALDVARVRSSEQAHELSLLLARDLALALGDLHALGFAHGDLKPANIIVEEGAEGPLAARLVDLGLATAVDESVPRGGTRRYLAPEVFESPASSDARQRDLWALGLVLCELLLPSCRDSAPSADELTRLPAPFSLIVPALLSKAPAARPSASWVLRQAQSALGVPLSNEAFRERGRRAVQSSYLSVRRAELIRAARTSEVAIRVAGQPAQWLKGAIDLARDVFALRGESSDERQARTLLDLSSLGRARWLVALVGPAAAHWPGLELADGELCERLLRALEQAEPERLSWADVEVRPRTAARWEASSDPVELALALEAGEAAPELFDRAEQSAQTAPDVSLALTLARALRRRGQLGRALALLERSPSDEARAEAAELARRAGDPARARELLSRLGERNCSPAAHARRQATLARIELDSGAAERSLESLKDEPDSLPVLETRALSELALGLRREALETLERARLVASSDEERARIEAARGNALHFAGDAEGALAASRRAAELAARSGAVLEEATYLTSVAAAASNAGELGEAVSAARRALLLFESLGRAADAARAALSIANALGAAGAVEEARDAALDAIARAKLAGDKRCRAYAHIVLADILPEGDHDAIE